MERYEIRKVETPQERLAAEELFRKVFIMEKSLFSETSFQEISQNSDCLVIFSEERPVAISCFSFENGYANIKFIAVAAEFRRQGLGKKLISEIQKAANEASIKTIRINSSVGARTFFFSNGFKENGKPTISGNNAFILLCKELA